MAKENIPLKPKRNKITINRSYEREHQTWVTKSREFLNSHKFHTIIVVLVIIDCLAVASELTIGEIEKTLIPQHERLCDNNIKNLVNDGIKGNESHSVSESHIKHYSKRNAENTSQHGETHVGKEHENHMLHHMETIMKFTSLTILGLFTIEVFVKLVLIPKVVCTSPWEIVDSFVVVISFSLNVFLLFKEEAYHGSKLLTILRLWRVGEIVNGLIVAVEISHEAKIKDLNERIDYLESKIGSLEKKNLHGQNFNKD